MIDIHPPQHAAITRREFFIHLATVVLGILIAIGLEQTVELIHHRHQREQIEESLHNESLLNRHIVAYDSDSVNQVRRNIRLNMANLDRNGNAFIPIPPPHDTFLNFINAAWIAARGTGTLTLLPDRLDENYWKVNVLADEMTASIASLAVARKKVNSLVYLHSSPSQLTPEERAALLHAYSDEDQELGNLNYILIGYDFMNEAALADRVPTIAEMAVESKRAQQTEGQPPQ
ncbi:MAG TPA: hypothetical protein VGM11_05995 [Acidobacteriaceae bacterium]|jgi:hypothetical protein